MRVCHSHSKGIQCQQMIVFEVFNCFNCDTSINSEDNLKNHKTSCQNTFKYPIDLPSMSLNPWPCDICNAKCTNMTDLERHKIAHHQLDMSELNSLTM